MGLLQAIWDRMTGADGHVVGLASPAVPGPDRPASAPARARVAPRAAVDGIALRCLAAMPADTFADRERVKWILLQPDVGAACRRLTSLTALGDKRADEARDARAALREFLVAGLPAEWPEHVEMLLDAMQTCARDGMPPSAAQAPARAMDTLAEQVVSAPTVEAPSKVARPAGKPRTKRADHPAPDDGPLVVDDRPDQDDLAARAPHDDVPEPAGDGIAALGYELHALPGTSVADIDVDLVREYVRSATRRRPEGPLSGIGVTAVLRDLKAIDGPPGRERLTVMGGLFFGLHPERLVVQSKIRFVEFPGTDVATPGEKVTYRYTEEVGGTIPELIARMERLHKERLAPGVLVEGFRVEELPVVPLFAMREAIVNAVCHRDYGLVGANIQVRLFADRLEVQSPGGLPGPVTIDNLLTESYARNPRIADMLRDLGYVERHGLGIDNMYSAMAEAHLPAPEFSNGDGSFTVTLRFLHPDESTPSSWLSDIGATKLARGDQRTLVFARRMGAVTPDGYRSLAGVKEKDAAAGLRALVRAGWLIQTGTGGDASFTLGPRAGAAVAEPRDEPTLPPAALDALPASQRRIFEIVARQGRAKAHDVLEISGLKDRRTVQRTLAALTEAGLLLRRATSRTDPNASYEVNRAFGRDDDAD